MDEPSKEKKFSPKLILEIISIVIAVFIAMLHPVQGLDAKGMWTLGIMVWAIINWIINVMPDYIVGLVLCALVAGLGITDMSTAFGAFSGSSEWLLLGAMGIGVGVAKSGLLKRLSLLALKSLSPSFRGQAAALILGGTVVSPLVPSTIAKSAIAAPMVVGIGDELGLKDRSKEKAGLFLAMAVGLILTGPVFLSGSFVCYTMLGLLPQEVQSQFTWLYWLLCTLVFGAIILVGGYLIIAKFYAPKESRMVAPDYIRKQLEEMGPMSKHEKIVSVILLIALGLWITERSIGVPSAITAVGAFCLMRILNVIDNSDVNKKISWSTWLFIGGILSLADIISNTGISDWLGVVLTPYLSIFAGKPYLFVFLLTLVTYLFRPVLVSVTATVSVFTILCIPVASAIGINPWVIGFVCFTSSYAVWLMPYVNSIFSSSWAAAGGEEKIAFSDLAKANFIFMALSLIALLASVPYWQMLGLVN